MPENKTSKSTNNQNPQQSNSSSGMPGPAGHGKSARIERAKDVRGTVQRLLSILKPFRRAFSSLFFLVIIGTGLSLLTPFLMGQTIDQFILAKDVKGLLHMVLWMLAAYSGAWLVQMAQSVIAARVTQKAMRVLRGDLFEHLQTLSLGFFDRHPHGDLMSRLTNDLDAISRVLSQNVITLFSSVLTLGGILVMMFSLNFWLALGSMIVFPFMMWLTGWVGKRTRSSFREFQMLIGKMNGQLEEMFSGQRVIMAFGQEANALSQFDIANNAARMVGTRAQTYSMLIPPMMGILSNANVAVVAGLGGWMTLNSLATVGTIATFISYSRSFASPLQQLGNLYNQIQSAIAGAERVFELIDNKAELVDAPDAVALYEVAGRVEINHVDFSYVKGVPVLEDVCLNADPGQMIALVGPTGAGKTTIVNLLTRFYDIDNGCICIDGLDIRQLKKADLRRQLGIVLQDTYLFSDTVMENIRYGRLNATDDDVIGAAKLANADQFIRSLPQGYDTPLSERAGNLSQGQRQLLAIARAILADPSILILDEATSSVDTRTEAHIQEGLLRLMEGRTSFVIAHRLSTIREADVVMVLNEGKIVERGTHDELLVQKGFYHDLYVSQFKGRTIQPADSVID